MDLSVLLIFFQHYIRYCEYFTLKLDLEKKEILIKQHFNHFNVVGLLVVSAEMPWSAPAIYHRPIPRILLVAGNPFPVRYPFFSIFVDFFFILKIFFPFATLFDKFPLVIILKL